MSEATIRLRHRLPPEDEARAEFYALLARLFADAPDASLLAAIVMAAGLTPTELAARIDGMLADLLRQTPQGAITLTPCDASKAQRGQALWSRT